MKHTIEVKMIIMDIMDIQRFSKHPEVFDFIHFTFRLQWDSTLQLLLSSCR